jgi:hypothetical protein
MSATALWIIAAILVVVGIVQLIQGQLILGILLIVACWSGLGACRCSGAAAALRTDLDTPVRQRPFPRRAHRCR